MFIIAQVVFWLYYYVLLGSYSYLLGGVVSLVVMKISVKPTLSCRRSWVQCNKARLSFD